MDTLYTKLNSLALFRDFLKDTVMQALLTYLQTPTTDTYSGFVSTLYEENGGDLSAHTEDLLLGSENAYVRARCQSADIPAHLETALRQELSILQQVSDLTDTALSQTLGYDGYLPGFRSEKRDLTALYDHRMQDIGRYGYGIWASHGMFYVEEGGTIVPVEHPDPISLSDLIDYERERGLVLDNARALIAGKPAANVLLSGDAGTGKSSTIKAVSNALFEDGLRLVEIHRDQLQHIPRVLSQLSRNPLKFILFIDDLSFRKDDENFNALKAVLEGSATARSKNVIICATSNRRHIIKETFSDRAGDEIHKNDTMQELISLSERFGLHISFQKPDKKTFLNIVRHLAEEAGLSIPEEELFAGAERFALGRSGRSARLARQYVDSLLANN